MAAVPSAERAKSPQGTEPQMTTKEPDDSAFKQQRLPAWQPIFSPTWIIPSFFLISIVFIIIGILIVVASSQVVEVTQRYDQLCLESHFTPSHEYQTCTNSVNFTVPERMEPPVYLYYELTKFYQNHRRYVQSRSDPQLRGSYQSPGSLEDCAPVRWRGDWAGQSWQNEANDVYAPCGLIAWSMYNDSMIIRHDGIVVCNTASNETDCRKNGIAWDSDKEERFKEPSSEYRLKNPRDYYNETGHHIPLTTDEDFIVWMRTAAFPTFRKLFRIFDKALERGTYQLTVEDRFPVERFEGEKRMVLSTTKWIGGKNVFLGATYLVLGCLIFVVATIFLILHMFRPRTENDLKRYLEEQNSFPMSSAAPYRAASSRPVSGP
jgi:hypothetical protein